MAKQKRGNKKGMAAWIWILIIILVLIMAGVVAYLLLFSGSGGSIVSGYSIPQPPALPS